VPTVVKLLLSVLNGERSKLGVSADVALAAEVDVLVGAEGAWPPQAVTSAANTIAMKRRARTGHCFESRHQGEAPPPKSYEDPRSTPINGVLTSSVFSLSAQMTGEKAFGRASRAGARGRRVLAGQKGRCEYASGESG
jgi:hypothetical protein